MTCCCRLRRYTFTAGGINAGYSFHIGSASTQAFGSTGYRVPMALGAEYQMSGGEISGSQVSQ